MRTESKKSVRKVCRSQPFNAFEEIEKRASYLEHFFLFQRARVLGIGGVDPTIGLTGADDYDMIWALLEHGASVSIVEECLYNYRDHHEQRLTLRDQDQQLKDLGKILTKHKVSEEDRKRLLADKAKWYGRPIYQVLEELKSTT